MKWRKIHHFMDDFRHLMPQRFSESEPEASTMLNPNDPRSLYLELLKSTLSNQFYPRELLEAPAGEELSRAAGALRRAREKFGHLPATPEIKAALNQTPYQLAMFIRANVPMAYTLVSPENLSVLQRCLETVITEKISGDVIECGVWRGGVCVFMRGLLKAYGDVTRKVWVADSFQGLPAPDADAHPLDAIYHEYFQQVNNFNISRERVEFAFQSFGLLDEQVAFVPGWFHESLPLATVEKLALIRLDGDYYESTAPCLSALYPKLSPGGFVIIDDYNAPNLGVKRAVDEFREREDISAPLMQIDAQSVYWRKA